MWLVLILATAFLIVSVLLIKFGRGTVQDVGKSFLTGATVTLAIFALQLHLDDERQSKEKLDQFKQSIAFSQDLEGFTPQYSLAGLYLSGKNMDNAELQHQDLRDSNLQGASLRGANLERSDLRGASLYDANLTGATFTDVRLAGADLRGTRLGVRLIEIPPDPATFRGAKVNAFTCWPDDVLANIHYPPESDLRRALVREPTKVRGRTVIERTSPRSWGRSCALEDENLWEDLFLYAPGHELTVVRPDELRRTVHGLATTFGRSVAGISRRLSGGRPMSDFGPGAPGILHRLCAGAEQVYGRIGDLSAAGFGGLVVQRPGWPDKRATAIRQPEGQPGQIYTVQFRRSLPAGATISLVVEKPVAGGGFAKFSLRRRVRSC